jgi:hypothetical protein
VYIVDDQTVNIDLGTLDSDTVHPEAGGPETDLSGLLGYDVGMHEVWSSGPGAQRFQFGSHRFAAVNRLIMTVPNRGESSRRLLTIRTYVTFLMAELALLTGLNLK